MVLVLVTSLTEFWLSFIIICILGDKEMKEENELLSRFESYLSCFTIIGVISSIPTTHLLEELTDVSWASFSLDSIIGYKSSIYYVLLLYFLIQFNSILHSAITWSFLFESSVYLEWEIFYWPKAIETPSFGVVGSSSFLLTKSWSINESQEQKLSKSSI